MYTDVLKYYGVCMNLYREWPKRLHYPSFGCWLFRHYWHKQKKKVVVV